MAKSTASGSGVGTSLPAGIIMPFAGEASKIPAGWELCDGRAISRTTFRDLFNVIGTVWGEGDGSSTFHLPDMQGMFLRGHDPSQLVDVDAGTRSATNPGGNTGNSVGTTQGYQVQAHSHTINGEFNNQCCGADIAMYTYYNGNPRSTSTVNYGGSETRPVNVAVNYIIKV